MNPATNQLKKVNQLLLTFVSVLLVSFHYFLVYFINSTYLHRMFSESVVGLIFAGGAVFNISLFLLAPKLLRARGDFKFALWLTLLEITALVGLAFSPSGYGLVIFFIIQQMTAPVLFYCLDMFLERFTSQAEVGSVRGMSLTMLNIPPIIAPFIAGLILIKADYWKIYLISAAFLVPFLLILLKPENATSLRAWLVGLIQYFIIVINLVYLKLPLTILIRILFFLLIPPTKFLICLPRQ